MSTTSRAGNATDVLTSSSWPTRSIASGAFTVAVALVCSAGCATRADLLRVRSDQREVRALLADTQVGVDSLRRRVDALSSQVEESSRGGQAGARAGARSTAELERKLADLEAKLAAQGGPAPLGTPPAGSGEGQGSVSVTSVTPPEPPRPVTPVDAALTEEEGALQAGTADTDYRDGIRLVRAGQCDQAVPKFRSFLRKSPKSDLADNAQYWIGECYYGQRDYNRAIIELNEVLLKYAKGDKVPSALLTLASAFADSGDKIDARLILQKLISDHPKSPEADRGRQKLQALGE